MTVGQLPAESEAFARWLRELTALVDTGAGWCGVFWRRDPEGMRACLDGTELPPRDVLEALLQDLATGHGTAAAEREAVRARALHGAAAAARDRRPGGRATLVERLGAMRREEAYAAERERDLTRRLRDSAGGPGLEAELAWARDDHARATARCAELTARLSALDTPPPGDRPPAPVSWFRADTTGAGHAEDGGSTGPGSTDAPDTTGHGAGDPRRAMESGAADAREAARPWSPGAGGAGGPRSDDGRQAAGPGAADARNATGSRGADARDAAGPWSAGTSGAVAPRSDDGRGESSFPRPAPSPDPGDAVRAGWFRTPGRPEVWARPGDGSAAQNQNEAGHETRTPAPERRPRGARYAGLDTGGGGAGSALPAAPPVRAAAPRGARYAGVEEAPPVVVADAAALAEDRRVVTETVASLVRLRARGSGGEAYVLLCEAAGWPAARLPVLAGALHGAGLGADWATLLWEAASLPPGRVAAVAAALEGAGLAEDARNLLRQGVARPAPEVAAALLTLDEEGGRAREVRALAAAFVRVRTPEDAAQVARTDPGRLAPLLLDAARQVSRSLHRDLVHALRVAGATP
ncbi:hypothetical protein [Streptomyces sp. NPDC054887]